MLEPAILVYPELKIAGFEASFLHALSPETNNFKVIPPLRNKLDQVAGQVPHRVGDVMYGIVYGRPESERSHEHELQYIAGVAVSSTDELLPGMTAKVIPAGTFAMFTHRGPIEKIGETCYQAYRVWLPQSQYQHAGIADVETYDERFCVEGQESVMEYRLSIVPKGS